MNTQNWQFNWNLLGIFTAIVPTTIGLALVTATIPVSAQQAVLIQQGMVSQPLTSTSVIYGSPIPSSVTTNSFNGFVPNPTYNSYPANSSTYYSYPVSPIYNSYPANSSTYYSYPVSPIYNSYPGRRAVVNSTLINPVLVNPTIRDSTLINPVIVNAPGYQTPVIRRARTVSFPYQQR